MDEKTLTTLEYSKILEHLAKHCVFPVSAEKARKLRPTDDVIEARRRLAETSEAVQILTTRPDLSIGGARDIREAVDLARHGGVLDPSDLLDVKFTLIAARQLVRVFDRMEDQYPNLYDLSMQIPSSTGIIDAVSRTLSERGDVLDHASDKLARLRREANIVHDRLISKLQRMVSDSRYSTYLQEPIVTHRDGRYVLPLRAEFKGRIKSVVHDQSASGATLFVEPLSVVEQNNRYRELQLEERDEIRRILAELSRQIGLKALEIIQAVDIVADIDLALAKAKYADTLRAEAPVLHGMSELTKAKKSKPSDSLKPASLIRLYQARHPLLPPDTVVPIDVELGDEAFVLVITGPNTGGKTVSLKTVGLLSLMAQSGLHIPVHSGSELSVFKDIFADIGDEQSIEQSLSTFSSHITNIIRILDLADPDCLVILDELGAGTDPQEGAALARSLLDHLVGRGLTTLVTTHHPELKAYAHATPGVVNASVEFDLETLSPTFHLVIGLPGRSNALAIAQRLGLPETIIQEARAELNPDDLRAEDMLDEIHRQRDIARQARGAAEKINREAELLRRELMERLENIEDERRSILNQARTEAAKEIQALEDEIAKVRRELARTRQPVDALAQVEEVFEELEEKVGQPVERQKPNYGPEMRKLESTRNRAIRLGDKVLIRTLGAQGVVTAMGEEEGEVQVGVLRVRTRLAEMELVGAAALESESKVSGKIEPARKTGKRNMAPSSVSPGIELDLRGKIADEALDSLDRYLDAAYLARLPYVRIIHGKGTGKLRSVVRQALQSHPHIRSFEAGGEREGGDGVTVAKLVA